MSITTLGAYHAIKDMGAAQPAPLTPNTGMAAKEAVRSQELPQPGPDEVQQAVNTLNKFVSPITQALEFSMDEDSGKTIVKVIDNETQTVLRQIPSVEALEISRTLDRLQGLLVRQTA